MSKMSLHTEDAGVSVARAISSAAGLFDGDERSELVEGAVDAPALCWRNTLVVSSTNSIVSSGHVSNFTLGP